MLISNNLVRYKNALNERKKVCTILYTNTT